MGRPSWTAQDLRGNVLVGLLDVSFAGQVFRIATDTIDVSSSAGSLQYDGSLDELVWSRSLDLFSLQPEPERIIVNGFLPCNVAALIAAGHSLEGSAVQFSQVRVKPGADGAAVDTWDSRRVCLSGRVLDAEYGAAGDDGRTFIRCTVQRTAHESVTLIPPQTYAVTDQTWKVDGRLGTDDIGVPYPLIVGYPGRDDSIGNGYISGGIGTWLVKKRLYNVLCVGTGKLDATGVVLITDSDPNGQLVSVEYTYTETTASNIIPARDQLGTLLAVVDYKSNGYGDSTDPDYLGASYKPEVESSDEVFFAFPASSGGGMLWRGILLRSAGDVIEWAMEQAGIPVDFAGFAAVRGALSAYMIDTVIDEHVNPVAWVTRELLPLLPVSLIQTESGVSPWVWDHEATRADAVCLLDVDADARLDPADTFKEDWSNVRNTFELQYSYNRRTEKYTHTARLGPQRIETTAYAKSRVVLTGGSSVTERVSLFARVAGKDGVGIRVTMDVTAAALSVTDNLATRTVTINAKDGVSTAQDIVSAINAGSALIEAETSSSSGFAFYDTDTPEVTLELADFGTAALNVCARSVQLASQADTPGPNAGVRLYTAETRVIYDHPTAARVLEWQAAAYGLPHRRTELVAPESVYGWLEPGATIAYTHAAMGMDEEIGIIEGVDHYHDGTIGLRLVFIDVGASPAVS